MKEITELLFITLTVRESEQKRNLPIAKFLIENMNDIDVKLKYQSNALILAAERKNILIIKILIKRNCNLNFQDHCKNTALIIASYWNYSEIVEILLDAGADMDIKDENNKTALGQAYERGSQESIILLENKKREIENSLDKKSI